MKMLDSYQKLRINISFFFCRKCLVDYSSIAFRSVLSLPQRKLDTCRRAILLGTVKLESYFTSANS